MSVINRRLFILDPSLKDQRGHHYSLTNAITAGAKSNNVEVFWYVNKSYQEPVVNSNRDVKIRKVFTATMYDEFIKKSLPNKKRLHVDIETISRIPKPIRKILKKIIKKVKPVIPVRYREVLGVGDSNKTYTENFINELKSAFSNDAVNENDIALVHTSDGVIYRSVLNMVLNDNQFQNGPSFHLCTPYDSKIMPNNNWGMPVKDVIRYLGLLGVLNTKVFLYSENELLSKHLSNEWEEDVLTLEIPPPLPDGESVVDDLNLNVVYLGAARKEKGFHLLPEVVESVLSKNKDKKVSIHFNLQCTPQVIGYVPVIRRAIERLKRINSEHLTLMEQQLSMDQYYAALQEADVVLLCYDSEKYRVRGSGIAAEAVAYGKTVIATPDTFPAFLADKAAVVASNEQEIVDVILKIASNRPHYKSLAVERSKEYRDKVTSVKYIKNLFERVCEAEKSSLLIAKELKEKYSDSISTNSDKSRRNLNASEVNEKIESALVIGADGSKMAKLIDINNSIYEYL